MTLPLSQVNDAALAKRVAEKHRIEALLRAATTERVSKAANYARFRLQTKGGANRTALNQYGRAIDAQRGLSNQLKTYMAGQFNPLKTQVAGLNKAQQQAAGKSNDQLIGQVTAFDPTAARQRASALSGLDRLLIQLGTSRQTLGQQAAIARTRIGEEQPDAERQLLNNYAARGMARSSGYGSAVGRQQADYARRYADVDTNAQQGLASYAAQEAQGRSAYNDQVNNILFDSANRLSGQAGQLGLPDIRYLLEVLRRRGVG